MYLYVIIFLSNFSYYSEVFMRILIIEDDEDLCQGMQFHLEKAHYTVDTCFDGEDALHFILQAAYDLIILDRMLPSLDGLSVLKQIRAQGITTPVIMVTALSMLHDKVTGLDTGADDYLPKPFEIEELLARVRALSRRPTHWENESLVTFKDTSLNIGTLNLTGPLRSCSLSKREACLIECFLRSPNIILPRHIILSKVWGPDAPVEDGNIDNYIHFVRRRLHSVGSSLQIKTLRGIGYRLEAPHVNEASL